MNFPSNLLARTSDKEIGRMVAILTNEINSDKECDQPHKPYWKRELAAMQKELRTRSRQNFRVNKYGQAITTKAPQ